MCVCIYTYVCMCVRVCVCAFVLVCVCVVSLCASTTFLCECICDVCVCARALLCMVLYVRRHRRVKPPETSFFINKRVVLYVFRRINERCSCCCGKLANCFGPTIHTKNSLLCPHGREFIYLCIYVCVWLFIDH